MNDRGASFEIEDDHGYIMLFETLVEGYDDLLDDFKRWKDYRANNDERFKLADQQLLAEHQGIADAWMDC